MGRKSRRKRELRRFPIEKPEAQPMSKRTAWLLISGSLLAVVVGGFGSMLTPSGWHVLLVTATVLAGLVFFIGVSGLASKSWILIPAFLVGVFGPIVLAVVGHEALLGAYGREERCTVFSAEEYRSRKHHAVDYVMRCPSGDQDVTASWDERLRQDEGTVLVLPPFRPVFAGHTWFSPGLLALIPVAMGALIVTAAVARRGR